MCWVVPWCVRPSPNAHVIMVPGVGHFVAQVKPDAFNQALEEILNKLTGAGG